MRVYALPSHAEKTRVHGVDYARIISPMKNLNGYKGIETTIYDPMEEELHNNVADWRPIMENTDIFYFNYIHNPWGFAVMGMLARKHGVKLIMDLDDDIWDIRDDNPAAKAWVKGGENIGNFTSICNEVDYITCTNDYLKHVIMSRTKKHADQIKVVPNYIDLKVYKHRSDFKDDGQIMLSHYGSSTHGWDLEDKEFFKGIDRIMREYPNVHLQTVSGTFSAKLRGKWGQRYSTPEGHQDIYKWISGKFVEIMDSTDILVTPLEVDVYNKSKSSIKYLEASSAKIPGVWQDIRQYEEVIDGTNGYLARTAGDWHGAIKSLIDDPIKRFRMGERAYDDVSGGWQIKDHLDEYADFFQEALDNTAKKV